MFSLNFPDKCPWATACLVLLKFESYNLQHCKINCSKLVFWVLSKQLLHHIIFLWLHFYFLWRTCSKSREKKLRCFESLLFAVELLAYSAVVCIVTLCFQKQPPEVFYKKVFLEISQNSQENTCTRVSLLIKLQVWGQQLY